MKKKMLVLVLFCLMFTLTGCLIVDHIMVEVGQGLKNVVEHDSYCIETDIYLNNPEVDRDENAEPNGKYIVTVDDDNYKYELVLGSFSYTYYSFVDNFGQTKFILNASPFNGSQETLWIIVETGIFDYEENFDYLLDINPEYFDLEEDVYTLNSEGEAYFNSWVTDLIDENPYLNLHFNTDSTTKVYVDTEHVNAIKTNMVLLDFVEQDTIYEADLEISFTKFDTAIVTLPSNAIPLNELILGIQESFESFVEDSRQAIIDAVNGLGEDFFDQLLDMEQEAMQEILDILHDIMGDYDGFLDVIEEYFGELSKYVEIDGLVLELLKEVLTQYEGELENIEDVLNAFQEELEKDVELLVVLFENLVEEYEEEIYAAIIEKIFEILGL